jgi:hypothetical protein
MRLKTFMVTKTSARAREVGKAPKPEGRITIRADSDEMSEQLTVRDDICYSEHVFHMHCSGAVHHTKRFVTSLGLHTLT